MKRDELLKTAYEVQFHWLSNQIIKLASDGHRSFLNADVAERAFTILNQELVIDDSDLEHFISVHLSKIGIQKLVTTLRVHEKRNSSIQLQVNISPSNKNLLDEVVKSSGKTKVEIINNLISQINSSDFIL
jgi:hypothetical protein